MIAVWTSWRILLRARARRRDLVWLASAHSVLLGLLVVVPCPHHAVLPQVEALGLPPNAVILPPLAPRPPVPEGVHDCMVQCVASSYNMEWQLAYDIQRLCWGTPFELDFFRLDLDVVQWPFLAGALDRLGRLGIAGEPYTSQEMWWLIHGDPIAVVSMVDYLTTQHIEDAFMVSLDDRRAFQRLQMFHGLSIKSDFDAGSTIAASEQLVVTIATSWGSGHGDLIDPRALRRGMATVRIGYPDEIERRTHSPAIRALLAGSPLEVTEGGTAVLHEGNRYPVLLATGGWDDWNCFDGRRFSGRSERTDASTNPARMIVLAAPETTVRVPLIYGDPVFFHPDGSRVAFDEDVEYSPVPNGKPGDIQIDRREDD